MASNLLTLQKELSDRLNLDLSNSVRFTRWINLIQDDICSRYPFNFLLTNGFIQTVTDITTGTVTTVAGSTTVTGLGTAFTTANAVGRYLQVANDTNWYEVASVAGQVLQTTEPLVTSASGLTYTLRTTYYNLPSNCFKVFDVRQTNTPTKLTCLGLYSLDLFQPDINTTSNPTGYFLFGNSATAISQQVTTTGGGVVLPVGTTGNFAQVTLDNDYALDVQPVSNTTTTTTTTSTSGTLGQIGFFPCPDAVYNIQLRYEMIPTDLALAGDTSIIPSAYTNVILDGAEYMGSKFAKLDAKTRDNLKKSYEYGISKMIEMESAHGDYFPILQASDGGGSATPVALQMPGSFPAINSGDY